MNSMTDSQATTSIGDVSNVNVVPLEQYQEKCDKLDELMDVLEKEREKYLQATKEVSDLNEAVKIAEERAQRALEQQERAADKSKDAIHKIQTFKDNI